MNRINTKPICKGNTLSDNIWESHMCPKELVIKVEDIKLAVKVLKEEILLNSFCQYHSNKIIDKISEIFGEKLA